MNGIKTKSYKSVPQERDNYHYETSLVNLKFPKNECCYKEELVSQDQKISQNTVELYYIIIIL